MTTDWSRTWAGANGWYDGYDSTKTGNFHDLSDPNLSDEERATAVASVREGMIGLLENAGVTRAQILDPTSDTGQFFNAQMDAAKGGGSTAVRDALQAAATHRTSHIDRDASWGEDDNLNVGRTFLQNIPEGTTIKDLYTKGFGREGDQGGIDWWESKLGTTETIDGVSKTWDIKAIAEAFDQSEEAEIRDKYADEYGRDIDDEGLAYWMGHTGGTIEEQKAYDKAFKESRAKGVDYTDSASWGKHSVGMGGVRYEDEVERILQDQGTAETAIRKAGWETLGQASSKAQRDTMPDGLFTDMDSTQVAEWTKAVNEGTMSIEDVQNILQDRGDRMDAHNQYDVDDYGDQATGMGRFASLQDIQATIDAGETPDDIRKRLAKETWGALKIEQEKNFGDHGRSIDLAKQAGEWSSKKAGEWAGRLPTSEPTPNEYDNPFNPLIPGKPSKPDPLPVNKVNTDYIDQNVFSDTFTSPEYRDAQKTFTAEQGNKVKAGTVAKPNVMSRLTDTSAQGVRMKRSKIAQSGQAQGTSQFKYKRGKAQSLNLS